MSTTHHKIANSGSFELVRADLARLLLRAKPVISRPGVHAMKDLDENYVPVELAHTRVHIERLPTSVEGWAKNIEPNLPWAEDHFLERVSGQPLNPAPSHEWWPYAQQDNDQHRDGDGKFSHTYPERFWPRYAGQEEVDYDRAMRGIRFAYGDFYDLIDQLKENVWTRQAYLPIWFPEDLTAARLGQRVPCTLGYHLCMNAETNRLDMEYHIRSCDFVRFFRDDLYMAGRLLQHVGQLVDVSIGGLVMNIANLHAFVGDRPILEAMTETEADEDDWL